MEANSEVALKKAEDHKNKGNEHLKGDIYHNL